jgi:leucyl/phenylalanyl-tRNA---protein transferase
MPILSSSRFFPPAEQANSWGLVGFGGDLSTEWLIDAYRHGIFPWPMDACDDPMPWFSPDPRAVLPLDDIHIPQRLARTMRSGRFSASTDRDFAAVIRGCAGPRNSESGTWITPRMIRAYQRLHEVGVAHSVEVWREGRLAGGVYGVAQGGLFAGESMFHAERDASKVALIYLVEHLRRRGYILFDIQQWTAHTARFGAVEISRRRYLRQLAAALRLPVTFGAPSSLPPYGA